MKIPISTGTSRLRAALVTRRRSRPLTRAVSCPSGVDTPDDTGGPVEPQHAHHGAIRPEATTEEGLNVPPADPLALDPYSPPMPRGRPPEPSDANPLGLAPYSPDPSHQSVDRARG
jgi:hypothetical protein